MDKEDTTDYILLDDQTKLHWLPKDRNLYFNKTTLIFGAPQSGKTTIVDEIMYLCKDVIPNIFVIAPTNASNNTYTGKVPRRCIKPDMDINWLESLLKRQHYLAEVYQNRNDLTILKKLFTCVATNGDIRVVQSIIKRSSDALKYIDKRDWTFAKKKTQRGEVERIRDKNLARYFRNIIRKNKAKLLARPDFNVLERAAIEYLDINPNILLIFDDCASRFKKWYRQTTAFKEIFYNIRWLHLTVIITTQDDKEIDSELRKTSMVQIYTSAQIACANFERSSNYYQKDVKLKSQKCISAVFDQPRGEPPHYRKLVYIRGEIDPFRYMIADIYDNFRFGCSNLWAIDKKINEKDNTVEKNPFFEKCK